MLRRISSIAIAITLTTVSACGGGGGAASDAVAYTGSTSAAIITEDNATNLTLNGFNGTGNSIAVSATGVDTETAPTPARSPATLRALRDFLLTTMSGARSTAPQSAVGVASTDNWPGPCGGMAYANFDINGTSGTGSITLVDFCQAGTTISGTIRSTATQFNNGDQQSTATFTSLRSTTGGASATSAGSVTVYMPYLTNSLIATANINSRYESTGKVYRVENMQITSTDHSSYSEETISGRYYDPDYGYIDLSTPQALNVTTTGEWPYSGQLLATGVSADRSTAAYAMLTAYSTNYYLELDLNGDGYVDTSLSDSWPSL